MAAQHLVNEDTVVKMQPGLVTYHHIMFDQHEIITANGTQSESYLPGAYSLPGLDIAAREELFAIFPELRANPTAHVKAARQSVRGQAGILLAG